MSSPGGMLRLHRFLDYLSTFPAPADVLRALQAGPFALLGMRGGMMWRLADEGMLTALATEGHTSEEDARYAVLPLGLDLPLLESVRENRIVVLAPPHLDKLFLTELDATLWSRIGERTDIQSIGNIPLNYGGSVVGAVGVITDRPWPADGPLLDLVSAVADALSLWMTHPASGVAAIRRPRAPRAWSLAFSVRQRDALRLVGEGRSTAQIAHRLGVSESSIKQDLQWAMSALRTSDRRLAAERARSLGLL